MNNNSIKASFRFLMRNKLFTSINILGLSVAFAVSFVVILFLINEFSYNHCFKNRKQIYRVLIERIEYNNVFAGTPYVMANVLKEQFPQIKYATPTRSLRDFSLKLKDEEIKIDNPVSTDSDIFNIFNFEVIGQQSRLIDDINSIVISQKIADKYFQQKDAIGKEITTKIDSEEYTFIVTGIFKDIPINATFKADCFVNSKWSLNSLNKRRNVNDANINWNDDYWRTWVLLHENSSNSAINDQFRLLEKQVYGDHPKNLYSLQNLTDIYLGSNDIVNTGIKGNSKNIKILSTIAILIILIAAFNYIILSTVISSGRSKEIGVRKSNGASTFSIRKHILTESILLVMLALPIALFIAYLGKPYAEDLFQTKFHVVNSNIWRYLISYTGLSLFVGLLSGWYSSSYLSRLPVISILKNSNTSGKTKSRLRYALIILQLVILSSFISATLIVRSQYKYAINTNPGHNNKNIIILNLGWDFTSYDVFLNNIKSYPNVINASGSMHTLPMESITSTVFSHDKDHAQKVKVEGIGVDYDFIETMGLSIVEGRSYSKEFGNDNTSAIILNEKAAKDLGIDEPAGKMLGNLKIIGIVKDFNLHSFHSDIPPLFISVAPKNYMRNIVIHYKQGTLNELLTLLKPEWEKVSPEDPFTYTTIEDLLKKIYSSEKNLSVIVLIFALFTLLIASLGMFALTLFLTQTQTKEIGIKKVCGCSSQEIILSFIRKNVLLVLIATCISIPITLYFMNSWLQDFSFNTEISWWFFGVSFGISSLVVISTIFYQTYKTSKTNPIEALRYE